MKAIISYLLFIIISSLLLVACSKKDEQSLSQTNNTGGGGSGNTAACDTVNMMYAAHVQPIIQANCYGCHGNGLSQNGVSLDSYDKVKAQVNNGKLIGVITHAPGFPPMPQGSAKLSDCNINKIRSWINRGALNN